MNQSLILDLLENNARLSSQDLADILNEDEASIKSEIQSLEKNKIICGYHTIINYNKALKDQKVLAYIEVSCTPTRNRGYPEVDTMYLLSGDCDFLCLVQGKTMFEVARFVSDKIACVEDVRSTKTLFVLKQYKQSGIVMIDKPEDKESRLVVTP